MMDGNPACLLFLFPSGSIEGTIEFDHIRNCTHVISTLILQTVGEKTPTNKHNSQKGISKGWDDLKPWDASNLDST